MVHARGIRGGQIPTLIFWIKMFLEILEEIQRKNKDFDRERLSGGGVQNFPGNAQNHPGFRRLCTAALISRACLLEPLKTWEILIAFPTINSQTITRIKKVRKHFPNNPRNRTFIQACVVLNGRSNRSKHATDQHNRTTLDQRVDCKNTKCKLTCINEKSSNIMICLFVNVFILLWNELRQLVDS